MKLFLTDTLLLKKNKPKRLFHIKIYNYNLHMFWSIIYRPISLKQISLKLKNYVFWILQLELNFLNIQTLIYFTCAKHRYIHLLNLNIKDKNEWDCLNSEIKWKKEIPIRKYPDTWNKLKREIIGRENNNMKK